MNLFEPTHLLIIAAVLLLLFGGKKIPELMRGVGQGVGELQKGLEESKRVLSSVVDDTKQVASGTSPTSVQAQPIVAETVPAQHVIAVATPEPVAKSEVS